MSNFIKLTLGIVLIVVLLALGPWLIIWSWNTLFGTLHMIDFNIWTWSAVILLGTFFRANVSIKK
jgi:hypothetical protein